ncbi:MAG: hypothetical protein F4049_14625 [Gemmatimonadetes bacterium]|nr:hypothetical protein [Gemmatimonadota bacterium]
MKGFCTERAGIAVVSKLLIVLLSLGTVDGHAESAPSALRCGTPYLLQAMDAASELSTETQRLKLVQRRSTQHSLLTPSGHFRVHYDTEGSDAVDPTDDDANGIPDYIDLAATVLDSTWELEVEQLGYNPPPSDNGLGGGEEYDVYVIDLGHGGCGFSTPVYGCAYRGSSNAVTHSHLEIDNNFTDPSYVQTRGLDTLRVTIAHEFHHAIQFGYYAERDGSWWQESTSTWMEEVAYPHIDDYLQYLSHFLSIPHRALNSNVNASHTYGSAIFSHFLDQHYGRDLNRLIWEELKERQSVNLDHFDRVIRRVEPGGLGVAIGEFAVWNYFTGRRHRRGFYAEGDKYPLVPTHDLAVAAKAVVRDSSLLDATGSNYLRLAPQLRPGGVTLAFESSRGAWRRHLLLIAPDSIAVRPVAEPTVRVIDWDQYEEVILVISSVEDHGVAYPYQVSVEFDPDLTDVRAALATLFEPSYPNPFRLGQHQQTHLVFDLASPSTQTRLSIFSTNGDLVWWKDLGPRAARENHMVPWDGRNAAGKFVASGVYHLLLEADGQTALHSLAVVRD